MSSIRSKLLNGVTRGLMWFIFHQSKPVAEYRTWMEKMDEKLRKPPPEGITFTEASTPIAGRWIRNHRNRAENDPAAAQTILYLHGGAFSFRMMHGHSAMVADLCQKSGASAFMPWYRLAPEHPFPAAPEDCLAAYRYLLDSGLPARNIVVMGDSAGGNLSLSVLHLIKRAGLPMPSGVIALSPITDAAQISATWRANKWRDPMYVVQGAVNPAQWYFHGRNPLDPVISPYYGDFSGFPPLYLMVGGIEALLDDSVGMARKAIDAGIPARIQIWQGMPHVFPLNDMLPEAKPARLEIVKWLAALRSGHAAVPREALYRGCVEMFDMRPITHRLVRETNDFYFAHAQIAVESLETENAIGRSS